MAAYNFLLSFVAFALGPGPGKWSLLPPVILFYFRRSERKTQTTSREERSGARSFVTSSFTQSDHQTFIVSTCAEVLLLALSTFQTTSCIVSWVVK